VRLLTDVTPLREHPAFRRLWLGTMLSRTGSAMTTFAITLQVYDLTRSPAAVGGIGVATFVPLLLITLPGGTLADRVDRRRLVLAVAAGQMALSAVLFALAAFGGASLWSLYALVALGAAFSAVSAPAQQTFIPRLVPRSQLSTAMALNRIVFQVVLIVGPALAGVITAWSGLRGCYLADVASSAGALWGVGRLPAMSPERPAGGQASAAGNSTAGNSTARDGAAGNSTARDGAARDGAAGNSTARDGAARDGAAGNSTARDGAAGNSTARDGAARDGAAGNSTARDGAARDGAAAGEGRPRSGLALTLEGLAFIRRTPALCGAFLADVNATLFALPVSLFPAINAERFGGNPRTLGLFMTAIGAGGLVSAVFAGPLKHATRQGLVMLACVALWGGAFALFAVAPSLWLTLLALAIAGFADTFTVVVRGIIVQEATPDEFRGRVNAADFLVGAGGSQLGSLEAGLVGSWTTPVISALSGGLATVAGAAAIGALLPAFRRYRAPAPYIPGRQEQATVNDIVNSCTGTAAVAPESSGAC
jgi:MFS family permease